MERKKKYEEIEESSYAKIFAIKASTSDFQRVLFVKWIKSCLSVNATEKEIDILIKKIVRKNG